MLCIDIDRLRYNCRWRNILPFGLYLPFSETRKFWRNVCTVHDVVMDIISKKRQQLQQGEGMHLIN